MFPKISACLIVLILTTCIVTPAIPEPTATASAIPTVKITETPVPTLTPTLEPTTTPEPQIENDLIPTNEEYFSTEFKGV